MTDALAYLREKGVPSDAPLGSLQVAGDPGAPAIAIGGGPGETGNADVVSSRRATTNTDRLYPVTCGSSHVQAVAFEPGGVRASTVLTYGVATDPTRASSTDETRLFSQEGWVDVAFTPEQVRRGALQRYTVRA